MNDSGSKKVLLGILFALFAIMTFGLVWFFLGSSASPVGFGWYLFSFAAGLSMIVLPCTLPLAFVIVPLSMGKGPMKGFLIALAFGFGVAFTLSMYGVLAAILGKVAIGSLGAPLEVVKNWLYFIAGGCAYLFALGELGLVKFRMPTYSGAFPAFIQKQQDVIKALLLGLFLGNIGIGCPHPATPVILGRIAVSGDIFYGWLLFFVHAIGRILPLLFLAILGILGVNALAGLVKHKEKIERATGWGMVFVAAFILTLGLFSHDWWVLSGQHTYLEELTQEEHFLNIVANKFNVGNAHQHGIPPGDRAGLLGLPLPLGTWALLFLWIFPMFWYYNKKKKTIALMTESPQKETEAKTLPYLFWNFATISALLVLVFGYVLPHRFAEAQTKHNEGHMMNIEEMDDDGHEMTEEHMMEHMQENGMMDKNEHSAHGAAKYHEASDVAEGPLVTLSVTPATVKTGESVTLEFFVYDALTEAPITNLEIEHEKYMHVIGVRDDLNEFFHIHPQQTPEELHPWILHPWISSYIFAKPGTYKLWVDITVDGETHSFGQTSIVVEGNGPTAEKDVSFAMEAAAGDYHVHTSYPLPLRAGADSDISFLIEDKNEKSIEVEPYLGANMHLAVISDDLKKYIHTHPEGHDMNIMMDSHTQAPSLIETAFAHGGEETTDPNAINFHVNFPSPGIYKLFAQFRPKGITLPPDEALMASFYVEVTQAESAAIPAIPALSVWWYKLVVSIASIFILGWLIKKFITVSVGSRKK